MAERAEQRATERFSINSASSCDFASPVLEDFQPPRIKNISTDGIGLIASEPLAAGLLLAIRLVNPAKNFSKTMLARVIHSTAQVGGSHLVGAEFETPLTYEELCVFVL
jgi:hypothetical protein